MLGILLTIEQYHAIMRPINLPRERWGGFQHVIHRLQVGVHRHPDGRIILEITPGDAEKVLAYSNPAYGRGTYQEQLRAIATPVAEALAAHVPVQGSLF